MARGISLFVVSFDEEFEMATKHRYRKYAQSDARMGLMMLQIVGGRCTEEIAGRRYRYYPKALKNLVSTVSRDAMHDWIAGWLSTITGDETQARRWEEFEASKAQIYLDKHQSPP